MTDEKVEQINYVEFVHEDQIKRYYQAMFAGVSFTDEEFICIRGIGEKGTKQEGVFREDNHIQPAIQNAEEIIIQAASRYSKHNVACFLVPCVLNGAKAGSKNVKKFTSICADFDSGNTTEKLDYLTQRCGTPSMVVSSGGITSEGTPKIHVYYFLKEASADIPKIVALRDIIARRCGGDTQFGIGVESNPYGRAHQPIRVAGSAHSKNGVHASCTIVSDTGVRYDLEELLIKIIDMPVAPFVIPDVQEEKDQTVMFSEDTGNSTVSDVLTKKVYEGGTTTTRWGCFNQVAGHYIHCIRAGQMDIEEAENNCMGWTNANMVPPWPAQRVKVEFTALLQIDLQKNGQFPKAQAPIIEDKEQGLLAHAFHRWRKNPADPHHFLVDKLIIKGEPHLMVAEGGSGKTGLLGDLAMKIASYKEGDELYWCGQKIIGGGTVVLILNEDSKAEINIRLNQIEGDSGMIAKAGDRLIVLPMTALGGSFPLVERDAATGGEKPSKKWLEMLELLSKIPDLVMVCIDTLSSVCHGDENSSTVINNMLREANKLCGKLKVASLMTHHIRKSDEPIKNIKELSNAIRGSTAITSSFRIVFGMCSFGINDTKRRIEAMGLKYEKDCLWRFGICKANINGLTRDEKTLLRNNIGILEDATDRDKYSKIDHHERVAWFLYAIGLAAEKGHAYIRSSIYRRRGEFQDLINHMGTKELEYLIDSLLHEGKLVMCSVGQGISKTVLDVKGGKLASGEYCEKPIEAGYAAPDWEDFKYDLTNGIVEINSPSMIVTHEADPF